MTQVKKRRVGSVANELIHKSRESALAAVQVFNSPRAGFKSEIFIVIICIAWTYLLHAYYRKNNIEYRHYRVVGSKNRYDRTKRGAYKYWELERCLNCNESPVDRDTANNLRFLIGLRHEIEHQMTYRLDDYLSARFQACCLNFNQYIKQLFGEDKGIDKHLSFSLQFSSISREQVNTLSTAKDLPAHIQKFIEGFDGGLSEDEFNSDKFAYRVLFVAKTANRKNQSDEVIEFVKADSPLAQNINKTYALIKETERKKYLPGEIVKHMKDEDFTEFTMHEHTTLWKKMKAKSSGKGYGVQVAKTWYWYDSWLKVVREYCEEEYLF